MSAIDGRGGIETRPPVAESGARLPDPVWWSFPNSPKGVWRDFCFLKGGMARFLTVLKWGTAEFLFKTRRVDSPTSTSTPGPNHPIPSSCSRWPDKPALGLWA
jgi:hypothetical protein